MNVSNLCSKSQIWQEKSNHHYQFCWGSFICCTVEVERLCECQTQIFVKRIVINVLM